MMSKNSNHLCLKDAILADLWDAAAFDKQAYKLIEKITLNKNTKSVTSKKNSLVSPEIDFELSTTRNRNMITLKQQQKLQKTVVGFFGLSVGSHAAVTWMMESRANTVKIADPDYISPSNLNRLRTGWDSVGKAKTEVIKKEILNINPYANVIVSPGKPYSVMKNLFTDSPQIDIVVDEIDDLVGKIYLRKFAQEKQIPLLCATDLGDNPMIDIERYDLNPKPKPFLGRALDLDLTRDFSSLSIMDKLRISMQIIGFDGCSEAMMDSLLAIGKELKTWPQLGSSSVMTGGITTVVLRKIILGEKIESGRFMMSLENLLVKDYNNPKRQAMRKQKIKQFKDKYNIK